MKKHYLHSYSGLLSRAILILALFAGVNTAKAQVFQWAKGFQDAGFFEYGNSMAADAAGNAFYAGAFENTLQIGSFSVSSPGHNMYVAKVDPAGNVTWVKHFPNDTFFEGTIYDLETDATGNVYVTGSFEDSITIGTVGLAAAFLGPDFFLTKISPTGTIEWVKHGTGDSNDEANQLALDAAGNIYLTGYTYNAFFDFTYDGDTLTGPGEGFLLKVNNNGELIWGRILETSFMEVAVAPNGDGYLIGSFSTLLLDLGNGVTLPHQGIGFYSGFVSGFTASGQFTWANGLNGPLTEPVRIRTDSSGDAVVVGAFEDTFTYSGTTLTGQANRKDLFVIRIDDSGALSWAKNMVRFGWDQGFLGFGASPMLEIDGSGNIIVANVHEGTLQLDSVNMHYPHADSTLDIAIVKLTPAGSLIWSERIGGEGFESITGLAATGTGVIYISGGSDADANPQFTTLVGNNQTLQVNGETAFFARLLNEANRFAGTVFLDMNSSGTQDASEPGLPNMALSVSPGQMMVPTQAGGHYNAYTDAGAFQITMPQTNAYYSLAPATHSATFTGLGQADTANHFALQPIGPSEDLQVSLVQLSAARPGFTYRTRIIYQNAGTVAMNGTVKMASDTLLTFLNAVPATAAPATDTLSWAFTALQPFESRQITVEWHVDDSSALGTQLRVMAMVEPAATDLTPADNITEVTPTVTGSYDPNDKLVSHEQLTTNQVADRQPITFTVRFQNTGTDTAFTVMVRDQLSQLLDMSTLQVISSSHPFSSTFTGPKTIEWKFNNILLPDSNTNEPASHGYIQYRLKPLATLTPGQHINTSAGIYFDFNAPVATNVTDTEVTMPNGVVSVRETLQMNVFPNPSTGSFMLQLNQCQPGQLHVRVLNTLGQLVHQEVANATTSQLEHRVQVQHLPQGVYLLQVQQGEKMLTKRVALQQ